MGNFFPGISRRLKLWFTFGLVKGLFIVVICDCSRILQIYEELSVFSEQFNALLRNRTLKVTHMMAAPIQRLNINHGWNHKD